MQRNEIKARQDYRMKGTPAIGSWPEVQGEIVRVTGFEKIHTGEEWCRVRFSGDSVAGLLVHPSNLVTL